MADSSSDEAPPDALFAAVAAGNACLVEGLVKEGATVRGWSNGCAKRAWEHVSRNVNHTYAISNDSRRIIVALTAAGGNPFKWYTTYTTRTPFDLAWRANNDVSDLLPHDGMNSLIWPHMDTALHRLTLTRAPEVQRVAAMVVGQLAKAGAAMNIKNERGNTPLDDAIEFNNARVAHALLHHGGAGHLARPDLWSVNRYLRPHPSQTRPWLLFFRWSQQTHRAAPANVRNAVRFLFLCNQRACRPDTKTVGLSTEMVVAVCGSATFPWVLL